MKGAIDGDSDDRMNWKAVRKVKRGRADEFHLDEGGMLGGDEDVRMGQETRARRINRGRGEEGEEGWGC